jgi:hypothetical protein
LAGVRATWGRFVVAIKVTIHADKGLFVVNTPGSHLQRQPRVYRSLAAARAREDELIALALAM